MASNQEEVTRLKQKRKSLKSSLTRFSNYLASFDENSSFLELNTRFQKIEFALDEFDLCQSQLEIILEESSDHETQREEFEAMYYSTVAKAKNIMNKNPELHVPSQNIPNFVPTLDPLSNIKLPPLNLPSFNGNVSRWLQFRDTFQSLIHRNSTLTPTQKFYYLLSALKDEALQAIQSLQICDANYIIAWNLICERYQNNRIIINNHIKSIFNISELKKESREGLRNLLDELQKHMRSLESLQQPVSSWDSIIIFIVSSKLDPHSRRDWENSLSNSTDLPTYDDLIKFLTKRCQTLEIIDSNVTYEKGRTPHEVKSKPQFSHVTQQTRLKVCNFCKGTHLIYFCHKFLNLTPESRLSEIRKLHLCSKCLRAGHVNKDCRGEDCRKCNKGHNTLLHFEIQNKKEASALTHINNSSIPQEENQNLELGASNVLFNQNSKIYVLLSTATVILYDNKGLPVHCRALLDSGSQSNYITTNLANKLGLNKRKVNIPVSGISQNLVHIKFSTSSRLFSTNGGFFTDLNFLILDKITDDLPVISFDWNLIKIPPNIKLADQEFNKAKPVDLLLGASIFWSLLGVGQISLGPDMPILQKNRFRLDNFWSD